MSYKEGGLSKRYLVQKIIICPCCDGYGVLEQADEEDFVCRYCSGKGKVLKPIDSKAEYFVLRLDTDPHARKAALAYAESVKEENPRLAEDIIARIAKLSV